MRCIFLLVLFLASLSAFGKRHCCKTSIVGEWEFAASFPGTYSKATEGKVDSLIAVAAARPRKDRFDTYTFNEDGTYEYKTIGYQNPDTISFRPKGYYAVKRAHCKLKFDKKRLHWWSTSWHILRIDESYLVVWIDHPKRPHCYVYRRHK